MLSDNCLTASFSKSRKVLMCSALDWVVLIKLLVICFLMILVDIFLLIKILVILTVVKSKKAIYSSLVPSIEV